MRFIILDNSIFLDKSDYIQLVGIIAGIFTAVSLMPQLIKTIKTKKVEEISLWMLIILMAGLATWIYYGILRKDLPIVATNYFSFLLNIILMVLKGKYNKTKL
jgi:MtN3 and saliva related transmembrane protein